MLDELEALAAPCAAILLERGQSVAVADGSTGGLIAAGMLTIPGGIKFFRGGGVLYSLKGRQILFGLEPDAFDGLRPVSEPYTRLQADAISRQFDSDWGIAESGSAGPTHPYGIEAGTSCIAVVGPSVKMSRMVETGSSSRLHNMEAFAKAALSLFHEALAKG
jgi:PncC family amidohydrolase